jgi:hypothetical protein
MSSQDRASEAQALNMSRLYGISLKQSQLDRYILERARMDEAPSPYDSEIFERVLTPTQKRRFSQARLKQRSRLEDSSPPELSIRPFLI